MSDLQAMADEELLDELVDAADVMGQTTDSAADQKHLDDVRAELLARFVALRNAVRGLGGAA